MVKTDLAEFVDDDSRPRKLPLTKQMVEQRRLAAAEKAGENEDADHAISGGSGAMRTRFVA